MLLLFLMCTCFIYCGGQGVRRLITVLDGGKHGSGPGLSVSINKIYVFPMARLSNIGSGR